MTPAALSSCRASHGFEGVNLAEQSRENPSVDDTIIRVEVARCRPADRVIVAGGDFHAEGIG